MNSFLSQVVNLPPSPWEPSSILSSSSSSNHLDDDVNDLISSIDSFFFQLRDAIVEKSSSKDKIVAELIRALKALRDCRLRVSTLNGTQANWNYLVFQITKVLFENIALLEEQVKFSLPIASEQALYKATELRDNGFFVDRIKGEHMSKLKQSLDPIFKHLKKIALAGHIPPEMIYQSTNCL